MTRILVVDAAPRFAEALAPALSDDIEQVVLVTKDASRAMDTIAARQPAIVVVGPAVAADEGLSLARRAWSSGSTAAFVLVVNTPTTAFVRSAMKAGISDVVSAEEGAEEAAGAITSALAGRSEAGAARQQASRGRVVTMLSPKGGVGKSMLAANVAVALAEKTKKRVILVDLDLQFGDIGVMLRVPPERTLYDVAQSFDRLDLDMLQGFLTPHDSGVMTLLAPVLPEQAESLTGPRVARILDMLRELADYVVIDTPAALNETLLTALDKSDLVYAIATMDVASVKDTKIAVQKLEQLGYNHGSVRVVLNRSDSKVLMQSADVLKTLQRPVAACVPSDRIVPRSINKGTPVVSDSPRSGVARGIYDLTRNITSWTGAVENVAQ